ncbi:glycosyltransferase [Xenophilus arseniciresistens]|uniref:Glycosyltransferase n=1 Tax=Xenophilus arseniciresistens TaxID=1283306 RepID=A0AAE3SYI4_9BURK|nr:glycosyltransferase [Xenophilus arseniciresistens]MDA7414861.1 glycosyltransferase [Xenophilus arseniciresistens]
MPLKIAIAHHATAGLAHDACVLADALLAAQPQARVLEWTLPDWVMSDGGRPIAPPPQLQAHAPFDLLFLLEHAHPNAPLLERSFARRVIHVPNPEWLGAQDEAVLRSGAIDAVLAKTRHGHALLQGLLAQAGTATGPRPACVYTGWTSADPGPSERVDHAAPPTALHVAGTSSQKGSQVLLQAWRSRPDLAPLTLAAQAGGPLRLDFALQAAPNLTLHLSALAPQALRALQRQSALHLCPSAAEGFGHTLNEARAVGAVLLTTGAPPMDEFVVDGVSGLCIPVRAGQSQPHHRSTAYFVHADDVCATVERALALSPAQRQRMGQAARAAYEQERAAFHQRMAQLIEALHGAHP